MLPPIILSFEREVCDGCGGPIVRIGSIHDLRLISELKLCYSCVQTGSWEEMPTKEAD